MSTVVPNVREIDSGDSIGRVQLPWSCKLERFDFRLDPERFFFFLLLRLFWTLNASLSCILHISFIPDNDECSSANECHQNASCHNTKGSYNCTCKDGFEGDGKNCSGKILFKVQPQRAQSQKKNLRKIRFDSLFIFCYHIFSTRKILTLSLGPT